MRMRKGTKFLSIIIILIIISGIFSVISSIPFDYISVAIERGGFMVEGGVTIVVVNPDTPASKANLQPGDTIISINGQNIDSTSDFISKIDDNKGKEISITIKRKEEIQIVYLAPRIDHSPEEGRVGILITDMRFEKKSKYQIISKALITSYTNFINKPTFPKDSSIGYMDDSFSRLTSLIYGVLMIIFGIGLWKWKRWAMYGYLTLIGAILILSIAILLHSGVAIFNMFGFTNFIGLFMLLASIHFIIMIVQIIFAIHIYNNRDLFNNQSADF